MLEMYSRSVTIGGSDGPKVFPITIRDLTMTETRHQTRTETRWQATICVKPHRLFENFGGRGQKEIVSGQASSRKATSAAAVAALRGRAADMSYEYYL